MHTRLLTVKLCIKVIHWLYYDEHSHYSYDIGRYEGKGGSQSTYFCEYILSLCYVNLKCKVRIHGHFLIGTPFNVLSIKGVMSFIKYTSFINSLVNDLENSKLCCTICNIPSSVAGFFFWIIASLTL